MANAKKKAAKKPAAKKQPEPEIQVNRTVNETTESKDEREQQKAPTEEPDSGQDAPPLENTEQTSGVPQYEPRRLPLEHEGFDYQAAEDQRQAELAEQRIEHNRRTGDASRS
jgi:hypothetical protein